MNNVTKEVLFFFFSNLVVQEYVHLLKLLSNTLKYMQRKLGKIKPIMHFNETGFLVCPISNFVFDHLQKIECTL